jgi:hypothetical protein
MAHQKLTDADETFLRFPGRATMLFAGVSGTETWIERARDTIVHIGVRTVASAGADEATLQACISMAGATASGRDGPWPLGEPLRACQAVEVLVKAGERLAFKAYPIAENARVLRTVVWVMDLEAGEPARAARSDAPSDAHPSDAAAKAEAEAARR